MDSEKLKAFERNKNRLAILIGEVNKQAEPEMAVMGMPFQKNHPSRDAFLSELAALWIVTEQTDRKLLQMLIFCYTAGTFGKLLYERVGGGDDTVDDENGGEA